MTLNTNKAAGPRARIERQPEDESERQVAVLRLHLWLETPEGMILGPGRALLLAKIEEHGSLRKAAEEMGMSYRAAWGKIKKTEKILGMRLLAPGCCKKEGNRLTEQGLLLNSKYRLWLQEVEEEALRRAREIFTWPIESYGESPCDDPRASDSIRRE